MASALTGDDLMRTMSRSMSRNMSRKGSLASGSKKGWGTASIREAFMTPGDDVFQKSGREDDEDELMWAAIERLPTYDRLFPSKKRVVKILHEVSGIVTPSRMTLLLGPPGSGKTTLLKALAGKLETDLRVTGKVSYCGHEMDEFVPQRTCAYISQHDLHHGEMTVRETMDFSGRCLGVGARYEMLAELSRREKAEGIKPDAELDAFMKAISVSGQESSLVTEYVLRLLGLDICSDTMVGDEMRRGISGGQKKRVTTGEMLVGPAKVFLMDEISTGLDSSTTFQIIKYMRQMVHIMDITMIISLLQPAPETFELFDDIILLAEGQVVYQGPRNNVLEFFEHVGFKCPERKGVADFLQEVTSRKDQEQYWFNKSIAYRYVSVDDFVHFFRNFHIGFKITAVLHVPYDKSSAHPAALVTHKYGISNKDLFKACLSREWLLMKRNAFVYIFKTTQITIMALFTLTVFFRTTMKYGDLDDGGKYYGALFFSLINVMFNGMAELALTIFRLPVFYKQRDSLFYPAWAFALPIWLLRLPLSLLESGIWILLTYYTIGFAPSASSFFRQLLAYLGIHQMALGLFRFIAALGRTQVVANTLGTWAYYLSPMSYGQNAIVLVEFLDKRWGAENFDTLYRESTVGKELLKARGMFTEGHWYWICVLALFGFSLVFNICFVLALTFLTPMVDSKSVVDENDGKKKKKKSVSMSTESEPNEISKKGMVLPFKPLSLAFDHVNYYVDMPAEMKRQGVEENRLQLLRDVSGAFRPGILTALVGMFVEEVMELVELGPLRHALVGLPGVDGLSTEQRKRLTIAVELVANPSIIFMDEPTSGLDARAAAIVMRAVRNTVDTGRTVVCTIHQPSIDIFEAFDELFLMKRGGQVIYAGPLGRFSHLLVEYFETIDGVSKIKEGYNPATWMLDVSSTAVEAQIGVDFAELFANSDLYRRNEKLIKELSTPPPDSHDLHFATRFSQPSFEQFKASMYAAVLFLGGTNTSAVQSVVAIERTVFYREKAAGMYSALPYAFAQVLVETIYVGIQTFLYSLLLYSMIGFELQLGKFLWFYYYVFMCFVYFTLYGMMLVALTPSYQIAAIQIPIWWRWYYWGSPVAWTIYGLITSQVGDKTTLVHVPKHGNIEVKVYLKEFLGYEHDFLPYVALAHVGWVLLFFAVFVYGIKALNFQRR
ncbi:hypothetical protein Ccrd_014197 [Cynara cardunculus var. scolymus]|uniref:ABC transporter domain-containing protein n=1 Tax=Cynara cardunculus var. scolymus TaxID=59895 RepID=A0A118K4F3_CYNCS|nr:hypothetical protein Ccrd_014197 [Cynara cardunculus var. scolymus]